MRFALVEDIRQEASLGATGTCLHCGSVVIAKCGPIKVNHWAHKSRVNCDHWWEPETHWHRSWKNEFPNDWQERSRRDENGELHIADVLTSSGLALEFQHSSIRRKEVEARTDFHKDICWVVDGLRLENSLKQFKRALEEGLRPRSKGSVVFKLFLSDFHLLKKWWGINAPIALDFGEFGVWVIGKSLPNSAMVYQVSRVQLIEQFKLGNRPPPIRPL